MPFVTMPHQGVLSIPLCYPSAVRDGYDYTFWVYILTSRTGTLYIGITGYIDRRISQHKMDSIEGFTKKIQSPSLDLLRDLRLCFECDPPREAVKGLAAREKDCVDQRPTRAGRTCPKTGVAKCGSGDSLSRKLPDAAWRDRHSRGPSTRARVHARIAQDDRC